MTADANFEQIFSKLQQIVQRLEGGPMELDQMLESFEQGVRLIRECRGKLDEAQARIQELVEIDETGAARLRDFKHEASGRRAGTPSKSSEPAETEPPDDEELLF